MERPGLKMGDQHFTARERDIISCVINGKSNKEIGLLLSISYKTVETHNRSIMSKIGCSSRIHVSNFVYSCGKYEELRQHYRANILHECPL